MKQKFNKNSDENIIKEASNLDYETISIYESDLYTIGMKMEKLTELFFISIEEIPNSNGETLEIINGNEKSHKKYIELQKYYEHTEKIIKAYYNLQAQKDTQQKVDDVEKKKKKTILNKELSKIENKISKELDDDFGMNFIDELKENKLHQYLKDIPQYQVFYSLWMTKIEGNYHILPSIFIIMCYSIFRFKGLISTKEYKSIIPALDSLFIDASGAGKTTVIDMIDSLMKLLGLYNKNWQGTTASLRGSVTYDKSLKNCSIEPGILASPLNMDDEFRTLLSNAMMDKTLVQTLLKVSEGKDIQGNQKQTKQIANLIVKSKFEEKNLQSKLASPNLSSEQRESLQKKYDKLMEDLSSFDIENELYSIQNVSETFYDLFWKINSTQVFFSTPISNIGEEEATESEISAQNTLGLSQGLYNRLFFLYFPQDNNLDSDIDVDIIYANNKINYIKRMCQKHNKTESQIDKYLESKFVQLFKQLKPAELNITKVDTATLRVDAKKYYTKERIRYKKNTMLPNNGKMYKYNRRLEYNHTKSILLCLTYLRNKNFPGEEELKITVDMTNQAWHSYKNYLDIIPQAKVSKYVNETDYIAIILSVICRYFLKYIEPENTIQSSYSDRYPFTTELLDITKRYCNNKYNKFNEKLYRNTIKQMIDRGTIFYIRNDPLTKKAFGTGKKKIVLIDKMLINENGQIMRDDKGNPKYEIISNDISAQKYLDNLEKKKW